MIKKIKQKYNQQLADKDFSEILKGGAINFLSKGIAVILGLLFSYLITNYYGTAEMGVFSIVNSFLSFALIFSLMGMDTAIVRFIPEHIVKYSNKSAYKIFQQVFKIVFFLSLFIATISYFSSSFIAETLFNKGYLGSLFALASFFIIFQSLGVLVRIAYGL